MKYAIFMDTGQFSEGHPPDCSDIENDGLGNRNVTLLHTDWSLTLNLETGDALLSSKILHSSAVIISLSHAVKDLCFHEFTKQAEHMLISSLSV